MDGLWRRATAAAGVAGALVLGGCHPAKLGEGHNNADRALTVADRLDCPEEQGSLKRTVQAADGKSCTYVGDGGEEVTLAFLPLDGKTPEAALAPTEAQFHALVPSKGEDTTSTSRAVTTDLGQGWKVTTSTTKGRDHGDDDPTTGAGTAGDQVTSSEDNPDDAKPDAGDRKHGHVAINLPGVHINADDNGASIHAFGQNITADDKGATVNGAFNGARTSIKADDEGAEIRAGFVGARAVDLTYVLASDDAGPNGAHAAAYVARGPVGGPLVVASGTLKDGDRHVDKDRFDDLRALVDLNVRRARP